MTTGKVYKTVTIEGAKAAVSKFRSAKKKASRRAGLRSQQALSVRCPTCSAVPGEKCKLSAGLLRFEPHKDAD